MSERLTGFAAVVDLYDAFLFDAYGVLVDAQGPFPKALAILQHLHKLGRPFYILSNGAARHPEEAWQAYVKQGFPLERQNVITSGGLLGQHIREQGLAGQAFCVLGTPSSQRLVQEAGGKLVGHTEAFTALVVANQTEFSFLPVVDHAISHVIYRHDRGWPTALILPNPDHLFPAGAGRFGITAGAIAGMMEQAWDTRYGPGRGPRFVRLGKPFSPIFAEAARRAGSRRLLMIGDQIGTDVAGAAAFGIDSLLVGGGVTSEVFHDPAAPRPTYTMPVLQWE